MKKPRVEDLVMSRLFPQRKDIDPSDWQTYVRRSLIQEVRTETLCFYGPFECLEAQYPGLDYAKPAHRLRLSRFPSHRKLFRVLDELRLTESEIYRLCKWEGTRWARETYEANNRVRIKDSTWNGVYDARNKRTTLTNGPGWNGEKAETELRRVSDNEAEPEGEDEGMSDSGEGDELSEESEDDLQRSVGVDLNQRLLVATEARSRGEEATIDADWEQWLKEASENTALMPATPSQTSVYWNRGIPEYLSDSPASLRSRLPPPLHYYSPVAVNSALATAVTVPPPEHPEGASI